MTSDLCDCNDACILVRSGITITGCVIVSELAFENCATFTKCITKADGKADDTEDLDSVRLM